MEPESLIRKWLLSAGAIDPTLGWAQIDVVDLTDEHPKEMLFEWSMELFRELIGFIKRDGLEGCAILAVPLKHSNRLDPRIPAEEEIASIGRLVQVPGLYRTEVLLDAWQSVERFRVPVDIGIENDAGISGFYTCWRTLEERAEGEDYNRDLHYLWRHADLNK